MRVVGGSPSKIFGSGELPRLETPVNSEPCLRGGQEVLMPVPDSIGNDHRGSLLGPLVVCPVSLLIFLCILSL